MKADFKKRLGILGFAVLAGCATQPASVPPSLADTLTCQGIGPADNINYVDEHGRPMTERDFMAQVARPAMIDFKTCDRPAYPPDELRARLTGMVKLNFLVGTDGAIRKTEIGTSSGHPALDQATLAALSRCRFTPGTSAGAPAEKWSPVQYRWTIE
jgi:TonB family protein